MNDIFFRPFLGPLSVRGFVYEDKDGDYTVFINDDLSDEAKARVKEHELEHIKRGDLQSELTGNTLK